MKGRLLRPASRPSALCPIVSLEARAERRRRTGDKHVDIHRPLHTDSVHDIQGLLRHVTTNQVPEHNTH